MLLYHRTSVSLARGIIRDGFEDEKWSFGTDDLTDEMVKAVGVWLTDRPLPPEEGPEGAAVLEVTLPLPEAALAPYEIEGVFTEIRLWIIPAKVANQHSGIRFGGVDARSSWFHKRYEEAEE